MVKTCSLCHLIKDINEFSFRKERNNHHSWCNLCLKIKIKEYSKKQYLKNRDKAILYSKRYAKSHRQQINQRKKQPITRFRRSISSSINQHLKRHGTKQGKSIFKFLPYNKSDLIKHIESLFESWMNWDNYGCYSPENWKDDDVTTWTWQLDHIVPHCNFKYNNMEDQQFKDCWALSNLRPLSSKQNILEGARNV